MKTFEQFMAADDEAEELNVITRVKCSWCGDGPITLESRYTFDHKKYCGACGHQGARPQAQCECAPCIYARIDRRALELEEVRS